MYSVSWVGITHDNVFSCMLSTNFSIHPAIFLQGFIFLVYIFIALIHPIQWTITNPVGTDRLTKHQKKMSCVSTGRPFPVLCTRQVKHRTSFLSRQCDIIASFLFGACSVHTEFL